jgi:phosphoribosylamine-glycine ligase
MRVQKAENVNKALEFITSRGVKLTNIGPEGELYSGLGRYVLERPLQI